PKNYAFARHDDTLERLRKRIILWLAQLGRSLTHTLLHAGEILELALVTGEGLELQVHHLGDVDDDVGVVPLHHVNLADLVGLVLGHQLGKRHVIARERIDAVEHDPGDRPVVAMRRVQVLRAQRLHGDHEVGAPGADLPGHVAAEVTRVLELAVLVAEELDALDAEHAGGFALLGLAGPGQALGRHRAVARALVAVGRDDVGHLAAVLDVLGHGAAGAELRVVGMRGDHHDALDCGTLHSSPCRVLSSCAHSIQDAAETPEFPQHWLLQSRRANGEAPCRAHGHARAPHHRRPAVRPPVACRGHSSRRRECHVVVRGRARSRRGRARPPDRGHAGAGSCSRLVGGASFVRVGCHADLRGGAGPAARRPRGPPRAAAWRAWTRLASRPVVAFDESSVWVTQGRTLSTPTSVTLTEAQRMTATSIAMWRVVPGDEGDRSALEWRLVPGDSLALRSGDQVLLPAGAGVR